MAITKEKKVALVQNLKDKLSQAKAAVFVSFHGLTVGNATELRKSLKAQSVGLSVVKKTLLKRALETQKITGDLPDLPGEIAVAYGDDALVSARGVYEFEKKNKDLLKIVGGIFEGAYTEAAVMLALATIPSREVLYGKFVNIINSPIQRFVMALDQISKTKK